MDTIKRLPTHPGDVLKEELESRKISQKKFSEILGISYTMLNEILNGKRPVTSDFVCAKYAKCALPFSNIISLPFYFFSTTESPS